MSEPGGTLLLGVDGGGTSTVALLGRPGGTILGRGRSGPSNAKAVGDPAARQALDEAIAGAFRQAALEPTPAAVACLGLAGFGRPEDQAKLGRWNLDAGWGTRLLSVTDGDLVVAAGTPEGVGVGVIAGTGSIAVGLGSDGQRARSGGWGYLIGDEGSAYAVALDALRHVARRADGRELGPPGDPLSKRLREALGVSSPAGIVGAIHAPGVDRAWIAGLAPAVLEAAADDPTVIDLILQPAGRALAELVQAVARSLGWRSGRLPLAMAGGFLLGAEPVARALLQALEADGYEVLVTPVPEPALGALVLAERSLSSPTQTTGPA